MRERRDPPSSPTRKKSPPLSAAHFPGTRSRKPHPPRSQPPTCHLRPDLTAQIAPRRGNPRNLEGQAGTFPWAPPLLSVSPPPPGPLPLVTPPIEPSSSRFPIPARLLLPPAAAAAAASPQG
jgi:hypothetical protein